MEQNNYIERMSYENFEYAIKKAHERSGKNCFLLSCDVINSYLLYGSDFVDYYRMGFWDLNGKEKKTFITAQKNNYYIKKYNDKKYYDLLDERQLFNEKFQDYLEREWFFIDGENYQEFHNFIRGKKEIVVKTVKKNENSKIKTLYLKDYKDKERLYQELKNSGFVVVEEKIALHTSLEKLVGEDQVSIHVMTFYADEDSFLINAYLKIEGKDLILAPIDLDTGKVSDKGCDPYLNIYERHPKTNEKIEGKSIPYFKEIRTMTLKAAKELPRLRYIDWNIYVGEDGPVLTSANYNPSYSFYQFPHHVNHTGLVPVIEEILKNEE